MHGPKEKQAGKLGQRPDEVLNALALPELFERLASTGLVDRLIALAADEDLGAWSDDSGEAQGAARSRRAYAGDLTSDACTVPASRVSAKLVAREEGTIAGLACLPRLLKVLTTDVRADVRVQDGAHARAGDVVAVLEGPQDEVLTLERTLLNLVGRMSGVATRTRDFVRAVPAGCRAKVYDTRKTTPGMRVLEKYSVRCGGGMCHRLGLHDALLIKDNHLAGVSSAEIGAFVLRAAARARELNPALAFVEVEVDTLEQLRALLALPAGAMDIVLLDNMNLVQLREACALRDKQQPGLELEASGGVKLETVREIALTGVDRISAGALTHSVRSLDVALDAEVVPSGAAGDARRGKKA